MIECYNGVFLNPAHVITVREHTEGYLVIMCTDDKVFKSDWSMMKVGQAVMGLQSNGLRMLDSE